MPNSLLTGRKRPKGGVAAASRAATFADERGPQVRRTDDNGTPHDISVGTTSLIPAGLWNADLVRSAQVLNTLDGSTDAIRVQNLGSETVATGTGNVEAIHYALQGGLERDLWYAGAKLVHVRFTGEEESQVDYVLR